MNVITFKAPAPDLRFVAEMAQAIPLPALSHIGVYALAELFHQDRETALKLAAGNAADHWGARDVRR